MGIALTIWEDDKRNLCVGESSAEGRPVQIGVGCLSQHEFVSLTVQETRALAFALLARAKGGK